MRKYSLIMIIVMLGIALGVVIIGVSRQEREVFFKPEQKEIKEERAKVRKGAEKIEKEAVEEEKVKEGKGIPFKVTKEAVEEEKILPEGILLIADFNKGKKPNKVGGDFGAWDRDPTDFTQTAMDSFISTIKHGDTGYSIQIAYDVISDNPAYNGFWMKLNQLDATEFNYLNFWVKGDETRGFTRVFKVELKNSLGEVGKTYITGVTDEWQEINIPLSKFKPLSDFSSLEEFVIVFEDRIATAKEGAIYIDDIYLSK